MSKKSFVEEGIFEFIFEGKIRTGKLRKLGWGMEKSF